MRPRSIVITHREPLAAEGIAAALSRYSQLVVEVAGTLREAELLAGRADAVVVDGRVPGAEPASMRIRRKGVRVVTLVEDPSDAESAVVGVGAPISALAAAVCPGLDTRPRARLPLTGREHEVLSLIARGLSGKQVARHLGISPKTIEHHKTRIFAKLGVPNQTAACIALARFESAADRIAG
jgi:DNA-binding NarL/FixJ family response regulator